MKIEDIGSDPNRKELGEETSRSKSGACDVLMSQEYQFLYSYFGEYSNAQAKIVAATGRNIMQVIQHTLNDPYEKQTFAFSLKFKFVKNPDDRKLDIYIPPRPTLPIYLPRDVFYPFTLFSSNTQSSSSMINHMLLVTIGLISVVKFNWN